MQPSVLVHLSRIVDETFRYDPSVLLFPESTTPARFQRKVWISVRTLSLLRVGDIWRDGKLEASPYYQLECFADVLIDDATVHLIKAGLNLEDQGFLLPLSEHPWHLNCTHSYCAMIDLLTWMSTRRARMYWLGALDQPEKILCELISVNHTVVCSVPKSE